MSASKKVKNNIIQEKHTIKTQVIIEKESNTIIASNFSYGREHDFLSLIHIYLSVHNFRNSL